MQVYKGKRIKDSAEREKKLKGEEYHPCHFPCTQEGGKWSEELTDFSQFKDQF